MQLIGMLDSPFVRRTAVSMQLLGIEYEHRSLSVLSTYDEFRKVNPLVNVPTRVCGDEMSQADVSLAVAWRFVDYAAASEARPDDHSGLVAFSRRAEALPEFLACPLD